MKETIKRDSMVFYESFFEAIKDLPAEEYKKCVNAILSYGLHGETPETSGIEKTIFVLVKPQIDKNNQRWSNARMRHASVENTPKEAKKIKGTSTERKKSCEKIPFEIISDDDDKSLPGETLAKAEETHFSSEDSDINPNDIKEPCGEYNNVLLSVRERGKLIENLGFTEYNKRLEFFSAYLKRKPQHKSACHYVDLSDWVGNAVAERQAKQKELPKKSEYEFEDFFETP